jgi:hypothetical protein
MDDPQRLVPVSSFLMFAQHSPICSREVIHDKLGGSDHVEFFNRMQELHELARSGRTTDSELDRRLQRALGSSRMGAKVSWSQVGPYVQQSTWIGFADRGLRDLCKDHTREAIRYPAPESIRAYDNTKFSNGAEGMSGIQKRLIEQFDKENPLPVAIRVCPEVFTRLNPPTLRMNGRLDEEKCVSPTTGRVQNSHYAVVVGRRPASIRGTDGKERIVCQYLIRNSYGTDCSRYPETTIFTPNDRCISGQVWVDERVLLTNSDELIFIPDRPN